MNRVEPEQLTIDRLFAQRRARPSARSRKRGPTPSPRARVRHRPRHAVRAEHPLHVTIRIRPDVPSLRRRSFLRPFRQSLAAACERGDFRVVHYVVMNDHLHLIVEANDNAALAAGMKSVCARLARTVHRVFERRGPVLDGRFHSVALSTPRRVRNAIRYVLCNARKHHAKRGHAPGTAMTPDEASSGRFFDGWRETLADGPRVSRRRSREVALPRSWLLSTGWRRHGRISWSDVPGAVAS